jgi:N6-L-threonylcarbamoyladenine synthase
LGIESTAHTFGIGVVKDGKILANIRDAYTTKQGGIIPTDAARHHEQAKEGAYSRAIDTSRIKEQDIDAIAFSQGPGLSPCLLVGIRFAKELAKRLNIPLVPVNHCIAHLEIGKSLKDKPKNPVMLYVSGANTQVISYSSGKYRVFGETLDIGAGNFIDNFARHLGIGFPGGPKIEDLAKKGKRYIELPYRVKGMDISLSGMLTNLRQKIEKMGLSSLHSDVDKDNQKTFLQQKKSDLSPKKYRVSENERVNYTKEDLAYSMQETVFAMLVEVSERALAHLGKDELLIGGGVGCNSRLREMCEKMCLDRGARFFAPEKPLLVDNGAMIAFLGETMYKSGIKFRGNKAIALDIKPRQRTDEVSVTWK